MSAIPSHAQHSSSQVIQLVNSTINSNGSVSLSATIVNIHPGHAAIRPSSRATGSSTSRITTRALALERGVKQLNSILHEALGLPQEFVALRETLDKLLGTTIPRIIEFGSHGQTKFDDKLERDIDTMQVLVEAFMKNIWLEKLRLSASTSRSSVLSLLWNQLWWIFSGRWDVNRFHEVLEKIRCRVHEILLHKYLAPSLEARILDQQIEIEDFFGARWFLPVYQCLDLTIFNLALQARFKGGSAEKVVTNGQFHAFKGSNIERIDRSRWEEAIKLLVADEDNIQLSVVVEVESCEGNARQRYHSIRCPRCRYKQIVWCDNGSGWADCAQCESRFSLTDKLNENATFHVRDLNGTRRSTVLDLNRLGGAPYKNYLITSRETWLRIFDVIEEEGTWLDSILEALE